MQIRSSIEKIPKAIQEAQEYVKKKLLLATTFFGMHAAVSTAQSDTIQLYGLPYNIATHSVVMPDVSDPSTRFYLSQDPITGVGQMSHDLGEQRSLLYDKEFNEKAFELDNINFLSYELSYQFYQQLFSDSEMYEKVLLCKDYYHRQPHAGYILSTVRMLVLVDKTLLESDPEYAAVVRGALTVNNPLARFLVSFGIQGDSPLWALDKDTHVSSYYSQSFFESIEKHIPNVDSYAEFCTEEFLYTPDAGSLFTQEESVEKLSELANTTLSMGINQVALTPENFQQFHSMVTRYNHSTDDIWLFDPNRSVYGDELFVLQQDISVAGANPVGVAAKVEQIIPDKSRYIKISASGLLEDPSPLGTVAQQLHNTLTTVERPTILLRAHGDTDGTAVIAMSDSVSISITAEMILEQMRSRYAIDDLRDSTVVFIIESCFGSDFGMNIIAPILEHNRNYPEDQWMLPVIITGAEFGNPNVEIVKPDGQSSNLINGNMTNPITPLEGKLFTSKKRTINNLLNDVEGSSDFLERSSVVYVPIVFQEEGCTPMYGILKVE